MCPEIQIPHTSEKQESECRLLVKVVVSASPSRIEPQIIYSYFAYFDFSAQFVLLLFSF